MEKLSLDSLNLRRLGSSRNLLTVCSCAVHSRELDCELAVKCPTEVHTLNLLDRNNLDVHNLLLSAIIGLSPTPQRAQHVKIKCMPTGCAKKNQEKASAEIRGEFFRTKSRVNFAGDFLWIFGPFPWKKQEEKIHPKVHSKIQIEIWELRSQNPHCKDPALRN